MAEAPEATTGLTGMDWVVIVAATVSLVIVVLWLVQGRQKPPAAGDPAPAQE